MTTTKNVASIKTGALSPADLKSLKGLLEKSGHVPFEEIPVPPSVAMQAWLEDLSGISWGDEKQLFVEKEGARWAGAATLEALPFDTELYGFPMAKVGFLLAEGGYPKAQVIQAELLGKILKGCQEQGIAHLSVRASAAPEEKAWLQLLELNGFYKVAQVATFALDLKKYAFKHDAVPVLIRPFMKKDLEPLCEISRVSFGDPKDWLDKAHADPNLPKGKSDELYVRWFRNCTNGTRSDQVLVAEADGKPAGYIALKVEKAGLRRADVRVGIVELNAVDPKYRRRGIYGALVEAGLKWFRSRADWVTIKTQSETAGVHKVWNRLGAVRKPQDEVFFHKFFGSKK